MSTNRSEIFQFLGYRLDLVRRRLLAPDGTRVHLMPKAIETLAYLVEHAGQTVRKDDLLRAVWPNTVVEENNLTQNISALRKAFGEKRGEHRFIVTVPGQGYRFVAPVQPVIEAGPDPPREEIQSHPSIATATRKRMPRFVLFSTFLALVGAAGMLGWWASSTGNADPTRPPAIAILPFKPVLQSQRNEAVELGMADSLIMELSRSSHLVVRPLSVTRRFSSLDQDPVEAGRRLEVDAVVDGTIHIEEGRLRVSARLLRTSDGAQLWAARYDEEYSSLFWVQDAIAQRLAQALEVRLNSRPNAQTENLRAYELYMRGRLHALRLVMPEVQRGLTFYEESILADPSYALPHAGIADALRAMVLSNDQPPALNAPRARISAERAIELAPDLPAVNTARGLVALFFDWDWKAAEDYLTRAVELAPNSGEARIFLAHLYSNLGRGNEALQQARRARQLNPISPMIVALEGRFAGYHGDHEAAIRLLRDAITMEPSFWLPHHLLANALIDAGRYEESLAESAEAKRLAPMQTYSDALMGVALARLGRRGDAVAILESLKAAARDKYVPPTHLALIETALGNHEGAIAHLETALEVHDARLAFLKVDPKWNDLRAHAGFQVILEKLGL